MPGLKDLFVDRSVELRNGGGEAAPAAPFLAPPHDSNDAHTAIRSVDSNVDLSPEEFVVESFLNGEWLKGESPSRRFGEQW
jgi:hypothetical protein